MSDTSGAKDRPAATPAKPASEGSARPAGETATTRMKVDTSALTSSYCNVCNVSSTREEVVLNFGVNEDWDRGTKAADIKMLHRIILSPFAAKRVAQLLQSLIKEYETRHGELK
jgi:hypothetical protein